MRRILIFSALSTGLKGGQNHILAVGDSQSGKSYAMRSIGSKLFPDLFFDLASMSAKALYGMAEKLDNSRFLDGKIMFLDELADQDDGTKNMLKQLQSNGSTGAMHWTLDDRKRSKEQKLEGVPVIWSTSAEVIEDTERQLTNRPLIINPDESLGQTAKILDFQCAEVTIGLFKKGTSRIPQARRLLELILSERNFTVCNMFVRHIRISSDDSKARNTLPMFHKIVAAVAFANRYGRFIVPLPDGSKIIFATYADNIEAAGLWAWASGNKTTGLPRRHIDLYGVLSEDTGHVGEGLELEEVTRLYNERTGRHCSDKTVLNYLGQLSQRDMATWRRSEDDRHLWYRTGPPLDVLTASQLLVGMDSEEGKQILDRELAALSATLSQLPDGKATMVIDGLREKLLDPKASLVKAPTAVSTGTADDLAGDRESKADLEETRG